MTSEGSECGGDAPTAVVSGTVGDEAPPEDSVPAFVPPRRVDRYVLGPMLGAGGLGIVFEAWDPKKLAELEVIATSWSGPMPSKRPRP